MALRSKVVVAMALAILGGLAAGVVPSARAAPTPVVVYDSDMDYDDAATLAYLAEEHKLGHVVLAGVAVENNGAGRPGRAIRHARCVLERAGLAGIPIADGTAAAPHQFPALIRDTVETVLTDALQGCSASEAPGPVSAPQLIRNTVAARPQAQIVATGPLTNIAAALPAKAAQLTAMAGAVRVPGNLCCGAEVGFDNSQEFNAWTDPAATRAALRAYAGVARLVPLDATDDVPVTQAFVDRLAADSTTPSADLVHAIASHPALAPLLAVGGLFWWDPLAAADAVRGGLVSYAAGPIEVAQSGAQSGRTLLANTGAPVQYGTAGQAAAFEDRFLAVLNGRP